MVGYPPDKRVRSYNAITKINSINSMLQAKPVLVIEGEDDQNVYGDLFRDIKNPRFQMLFIDGKDNVKEALSKVRDERKKARCRGIVDPDYQFLVCNQDEDNLQDVLIDMLIYLDAHSLETLMWMTDDGTIPYKVLSETFKGSPYETIESVSSEITELVIDAAHKVGMLRLLKERNRWDFKINDTRYTKEMFDPKTKKLDIAMYLHTIIEKTNWYDIEESEILKKYGELEKEDIDIWALMRGHDLSDLFTYWINVFGIKRKYFPDPKKNYYVREIEKMVRLSCASANLKNTHMYKQVIDWLTTLIPAQRTA